MSDFDTAIEAGDAAFLAGDRQTAHARYLQAFALADDPNRPRVVSRLGLFRGIANEGHLRVQRAIEALAHGPAFVDAGMAVWSKSMGFMQDPAFLNVVEKYAGLLAFPNWHWNIQTVIWAVRQARRLPGDFVELGVFKGHTTVMAAEYLGFADWHQRWYLYDTFEGIPEDQLDPGWADVNRRLYHGTFSVEEVLARFAPYPNIEVIKGRVPEVLKETCPERISFVHMDLNSATAEIAALDALYDRIVPGGIILFDDYGWNIAYAQLVAEFRWMKERELFVLELPTGQGLFIKSP
jgi:O-methyltransferase